MKDLWDKLSGSKTYITLALGKIVAIIGAIAMALNGQYYEAFTAVIAIFGFAGGSTLRHGIAKAEAKSKEAAEASALLAEELKAATDLVNRD